MRTVLIGLALALAATTCSSNPVTGRAAAPLDTIWGGDHIELAVTDSGGRLEFDCAQGTIDEPVLPDAKGTFTLRGTFVAEHPGPSRDDVPPVKATYSGSIKNDRMTLRVVVEGQDPKGTTYELVRDRRGNVRKCR